MQDQWSDAIKEAYANAPQDTVILATLELRHSAWTSPVRVVKDTVDLTALIEPGADANPGEVVTFTACAFDALPPESSDKLPEITIKIDNVSRDLSDHLDAAMAVREPVEITYREYLHTDAETNGPHYVLNGLTLRRTTCTATSIKGTATFGDYINRAFPNKMFTAAEFQGLVR
jgi:hypothetical protein